MVNAVGLMSDKIWTGVTHVNVVAVFVVAKNIVPWELNQVGFSVRRNPILLDLWIGCVLDSTVVKVVSVAIKCVASGCMVGCKLHPREVT